LLKFADFEFFYGIEIAIVIWRYH